MESLKKNYKMSFIAVGKETEVKLKLIEALLIANTDHIGAIGNAEDYWRWADQIFNYIKNRGSDTPPE